jgi:alcohol dehydrogenase (cytochrome c)
MGFMRTKRVVALISILAVISGCVAIAAVPSVKWRARVVFCKATGQIDDVGWSDLNWMLRPGSGIYLERLADVRNPFLVIENPRRSKADLEAGTKLFRVHCSACHGDDAQGGPGGPSLRDHVFRQGSSDWALYRTITRGIPGTPMVGRQLPKDDVWRLVSYLAHSLAEHAGDSKSSEALTPPMSVKPVTKDDLRNAKDAGAEWLTYSGSYSGRRYSRLGEINRNNIGQLRVEWQRQFSTGAERVETSPIVRGSAMFVTEPPNRILALDAASGRVLWTYSRELPSRLPLCCGPVNRGVALLGDNVFVGTLDGHLISLDASSGKVEWDVKVADQSLGYSITGAPLAVEDMIVTGVGGGEFGVRGFVDAYDAASGKRRWRFYTVPGAGESGSETWENNSLRSGGAPTWLTGSFDPELRLIYWGVGNPSPNYNGRNRKGDNLYSNSVLALDADSGKLRWYFQFTPHDAHDWDSVQIPVLVDATLDGSSGKLLAWANRNGFYYLLDRTTGKFLFGLPFVKQNWAEGFDVNGRPHTRPESEPSPEGSLVYPSLFGGTNWWSPTYDPELGLFYVSTTDRGGIFYVLPGQPTSDEGFILGGVHTRLPNEETIVSVKALEVLTGRVRWQYTRPPVKALDQMGGLMSTAGGIVFGGERESLFALDARTGEELWHFDAGGQVVAAPVTYELGGRQYIVVAAGRSILAFALPRHDSPRSAGIAVR